MLPFGFSINLPFTCHVFKVEFACSSLFHCLSLVISTTNSSLNTPTSLDCFTCSKTALNALSLLSLGFVKNLLPSARLPPDSNVIQWSIVSVQTDRPCLVTMIPILAARNGEPPLVQNNAKNIGL